MGGHGTSIGGMIVDSGKFPWEKGNFPCERPSPAYHGMKFSEVRTHRVHHQVPCGGTARPGSVHQPVQCVPVSAGHRDSGHANGSSRRKYPGGGEVPRKPSSGEWVKYPSLPSSPITRWRKKYVPKGAGAVFSFGIKGGYEGGRKFIDSSKCSRTWRTSAMREAWSFTGLDDPSATLSADQQRRPESNQRWCAFRSD